MGTEQSAIAVAAARAANVQRVHGRRPRSPLPRSIIPPDCPALALDDWVLLNADDPVILQTPEGRTLAGNVDVVAHDASIFWIWIEGGGGRIAVHEHGDCQVWRADEILP